MSVFWVDSNKGIEIKLDTFFESLRQEGINNIYIQNDNPYLVFLSLLRNLLCGKKSIILDSDFSKEEIIGLGIANEDIISSKYLQPNLISNFSSFNDVFSFLKNKANDLEIEIFTSGTSGRPKKVSQTLKNVTRAVKEEGYLKNSIWGFAYNPTHFAGLQVFFQALFNMNPLVYVFNKGYDEIYTDLLNNKVTHLSCTPTYMKLLLPNIQNPMEKVESLTFGGEKFDPNIEQKIAEKFPNASIKNVYASTEAGSLLRSEGEYFAIPEKYNSLIKIENDELLINKVLLGKSKSFTLDGDWFKTGDIVEFLNGSKFRFKNRESEMINVGGYKVNPTEIEVLIKKIEGVTDAIVFGRKNSVLGNIIVANIIKEPNQGNRELKEKIITITKVQLQEYKIPRLIKFVDSFDLTRTGKIKKQ